MTPATTQARTRHNPILISGCSSGIGAATAASLVQAGHTVYATARKTETLADLKALGCHPLALDVNSEDSMIAAVKTVEAEHGRVGTLINNAGLVSTDRSRSPTSCACGPCSRPTCSGSRDSPSSSCQR